MAAPQKKGRAGKGRLARAVDAWLGTAPTLDPLEPEPGSGLVGAVVVTGGSDGIGFAIARRFAEHGHHVVLVARRLERLDAAVMELRRAHENFAVSAFSLDVREETAPADLQGWLREQGLFCDVLVNAAGVGSSGPYAAESAEKLEQVVALNVAGLSRLTRAVLPDMLRRRRGGVLNVASFGGFPPGPYQAAYYASKAFVISLSEALAWENRRLGVRICVVVPGPVETAFHARMGAETALYRRLLPAMTPTRVAAIAVRGYRLGRTLIVPGILFGVANLGLRVMPRKLQAAAVGLLLKPRGARHDAR